MQPRTSTNISILGTAPTSTNPTCPNLFSGPILLKPEKNQLDKQKLIKISIAEYQGIIGKVEMRYLNNIPIVSPTLKPDMQPSSTALCSILLSASKTMANNKGDRISLSQTLDLPKNPQGLLLKKKEKVYMRNVENMAFTFFEFDLPMSFSSLGTSCKS